MGRHCKKRGRSMLRHYKKSEEKEKKEGTMNRAPTK